MIKIIYNSPAIPQAPYNVIIGAEYQCVKVGGKYIVRGNSFEKEFALDFIKTMFKPCKGYDWDMLEETKKENNKINIDNKNNKNKQTKGGGK